MPYPPNSLPVIRQNGTGTKNLHPGDHNSVNVAANMIVQLLDDGGVKGPFRSGGPTYDNVNQVLQALFTAQKGRGRRRVAAGPGDYPARLRCSVGWYRARWGLLHQHVGVDDLRPEGVRQMGDPDAASGSCRRGLARARRLGRAWRGRHQRHGWAGRLPDAKGRPVCDECETAYEALPDPVAA